MGNQPHAEIYGDRTSRRVRGYANQQMVEYLANDTRVLAGRAQAAVSQSERFVMEIKVLNNVVADFQVAIFNITQIGASAEEAERLATERTSGFMRDLRGLGIADSSMFQDIISFAPYYSTTKRLFTSSMVKKPAGFELQKNIHIRFADGKLINQILSIAARHEIYDLVRVDYYVEDIQQVYHTMRLKAIEEANLRQEAFASIGMDLSEVHRKLAEGHETYMPQDRYLDYTGVTLIAKEEKMEGGNETDDFRNPQTAFYAPVSYQEFDVVLNPVIMEPVVQFTYTLKIDFEYPYKSKDEEATPPLAETREDKGPSRVYYLVTPNGEIKLITETT